MAYEVKLRMRADQGRSKAEPVIYAQSMTIKVPVWSLQLRMAFYVRFQALGSNLSTSIYPVKTQSNFKILLIHQSVVSTTTFM